MNSATGALAAATPEIADGETKAVVLAAAERLFALHGFQNVSVRDITTEAGANLASVNYHFGSKDALLFEIFRRGAEALNRERAKRLHEAEDRHGGTPPLREILEALLGPPVRWAAPGGERAITLQFMIRARSEGTPEMREAIAGDVSHLTRFSAALIAACPTLKPEEVYWRLHFCLGVIHNSRLAEFDRLRLLSGGLTDEDDVEALLTRMLDFCEAGFRS
jgi:AcrR family transcriptional regulator